MSNEFPVSNILQRQRLLSTAILLCLAAQAHAVCYVNATGTGDGSSWASAAPFLQPVLANHACSEIWVAKGIYKPELPAANPTNSFEIRPGTAVYGGFAGNETERISRDPVLNPTILSGDIDDNDILTNGYTADATDIHGTNSYHVVHFDGTTVLGPVLKDTVLDGFTVTAGQATSPSTHADDVGGGIYCKGDGSGHECSPTLQNLRVVGNTAYFSGGGIGLSADDGGATNATIVQTTISGNTAASAGGMYVTFDSGTADVSMNHVTFQNNRALVTGGALEITAYQSATGHPTITNCLFTNNSAQETGGAVFVFSSNSATVDPSFVGSTFVENVSGLGGAIILAAWNNATSDPVFLNDTFAYNEATNYGGAIASITRDTVPESTVLRPHLYSVTFQGNSAPRGGAMYNGGNLFSGETVDTVHPEVVNSILWNDYASDSGQEIFHAGGTTVISYSLVEGGCPSGDTCDHILNEDPKLGMLDQHGGFAPTYLPSIDSIVVDAGTNLNCPTTDQRGYPRSDGHCDIGATEVGATSDEIFKDDFE